MDWELLTPEERELREQIVLIPQEDGTYRSMDTEPERAAELRRILAEQEKAMDAEMLEWQRQDMEQQGEVSMEPTHSTDNQQTPKEKSDGCTS